MAREMGSVQGLIVFLEDGIDRDIIRFPLWFNR